MIWNYVIGQLHCSYECIIVGIKSSSFPKKIKIKKYSEPQYWTLQTLHSPQRFIEEKETNYKKSIELKAYALLISCQLVDEVVMSAAKCLGKYLHSKITPYSYSYMYYRMLLYRALLEIKKKIVWMLLHIIPTPNSLF